MKIYCDRDWPCSFRFWCISDKWKRHIVLDAGLGLFRNHPTGWTLCVGFILGSVWLHWDARMARLDATGRSFTIALIPRIFIHEGGSIYFFSRNWNWRVVPTVRLAQRAP